MAADALAINTITDGYCLQDQQSTSCTKSVMSFFLAESVDLEQAHIFACLSERAWVLTHLYAPNTHSTTIVVTHFLNFARIDALWFYYNVTGYEHLNVRLFLLIPFR